MKGISRMQQRHARSAIIRRWLIRVILAGLFACILALILGAAFCSPKVKYYEYSTCDCLWELAERYCPDNMDKWKYIEEVRRLNAMEDYTVYARREYMVPIYE